MAVPIPMKIVPICPLTSPFVPIVSPFAPNTLRADLQQEELGNYIREAVVDKNDARYTAQIHFEVFSLRE